MHFPISEVTINPIILISIGFAVGVLGGFFGVGGGFLAAPMMFLTGVPFNFVVGTDLAHMTGKSIVAVQRHNSMGHVDFKLGLLMILGTIPGVELGARVIEMLEERGTVEQVIGTLYIVILMLIGIFMLWESLSAIRHLRQGGDERDAVMFNRIARFIRRFRVPPFVNFPRSGIKDLSLWVLLGVGFVSGLLSGMLGVGGGFIRMPMLVYVLGLPTHIAVGTDLFEIIISAGYGTVTHALKGNVDVLIALVMHTGAAMGAQLGSSLTRFVTGPRIRLLFSLLPMIAALLMLWRLLTNTGL